MTDQLPEVLDDEVIAKLADPNYKGVMYRREMRLMAQECKRRREQERGQSFHPMAGYYP